jgi:hypothetical protein
MGKTLRLDGWLEVIGMEVFKAATPRTGQDNSNITVTASWIWF